MAPLRVLIFESDATGHRLQHVRVCVEAIADLDVEIVFATSATTPGSDEFRTHVAPVLHRVTVDASFEAADGASPWQMATRRAAECAAAVERHRPDHVYVLYADGLAQITGIARLVGRARRHRRVEYEGILMRGRFAYPHRSWPDAVRARAWLAATALSPFDILHFLDPIPYERIVQHGGRLATRARLIPEPVEPPTITSRDEARRRLRLPPEGRIVCCPGGLDQRKGVDRLIRAFAACQGTLRPDDRLLLIGRVHESIREAIQATSDLRQCGRIILRDEFVSDEDLHHAISAADVVAAPYPRHIGSSGIVVRAVALERLVLASDFGWIGMVASRFGLGPTCDCRDDGAIARSLSAALAASPSYRPSAAARRFARYHTKANYEAHLARRLRQRLGHGSVRDLCAWDWVLQASAETPATTSAHGEA